MDFPQPLIEGKLVKRYKRFFADVELPSGEIVTSHCANTGSMRSCGSAGDTVYLLANDDPKRKLKFTWELTKTDGGFIGVNTNRPNQVVFEAIANNAIKELTGYSEQQREKKYGQNSRIDILLKDSAKADCYVEIKNATLYEEGRIMFPDAVTSRGLKHIHDLIDVVANGERGVLFFLCNRPEGRELTVAEEIDPKYAAALREAVQKGVEVLAYRAEHTTTSITVGNPVKINI